MTPRPSIHELLEQYAALDDMGRIAVTSAMHLAAGVIMGALEAEKAGRAAVLARIAEADRRIAERDAQEAVSVAATCARFTTMGFPPEMVREARRQARSAPRR